MLAHQLLVGLGTAEGEGRFMFVHPAGFEPAKVSRDVKVRRSRDSHQEEEHIYPHPPVFIELCTLAALRGTVPREIEYNFYQAHHQRARGVATRTLNHQQLYSLTSKHLREDAEEYTYSLINLCLLSLWLSSFDGIPIEELNDRAHVPI